MAGPAANTTTVLDYAFKDVYAANLMNLLPEAARLQKDIKFVGNDKREGRAFVQPVRLTRPAGWTLDTSGDAYALNAPEPSRGDEARVSGSSFVLRDVLSYDAAAKAVKGTRAFVNGTSQLVEMMADTAAFILETQLIHGQRNVGLLATRTDDSGTSQTFTVSAGTFMPAMWSGMENSHVEIRTTAGLNLTPSGAQISAVDIDGLALTLTGVESELDAVNTDLANDPEIFLRNTYDAGMRGLVLQASNTGVQFGIDASDYSLWKGNSYATTGTLTFAKLIRAADKAVSRGAGGAMRFYVPTGAWSDCMNDLAALRRYANQAGGKLEQGADELMFHGQGGSLIIVPHVLMKPSEALGLPVGGSKVQRLGASDLTFSIPGTGQDKFWEHLPDHAGFGTRCYWHQAVLLSCPSKAVLVTGIESTSP